MVVTFGEIMLRLSPPGYLRLKQTNSLDIAFGGCEANVAVSLANFGNSVKFITRLPENDISEACIGELNRYGVNTSSIVKGRGRMGIYFYEKGASQRASKVIYDRAYSAMTKVTSDDFDWKNIFNNAEWFHFSGITPALGDNVAAAVLEACKVAKERGITISCDLNYRKKLWSREKARETMRDLMEYVDVLIANEEDAADVFGIHAANSDIISGNIDYSGYESAAKQLARTFGLKKVAITLRESLSASVNNWSGLLYSEGNTYFSNKYTIQIVDRVGGGDSFAAGLIYGTLKNYNDAEILEFAVAASCLKHTIEGDFNLVTVEEVNRLMDGDKSGRVQR